MRLAIVDARISDECRRSLMREGFYIVEVSASKKLPPPLASHPDMLIFADGKELISSSSYMDEAPFVFEDISRLISGLKITFTDEELGGEYPHDAIFNALKIGNKIFMKTDTVSKKLIEYAESHGLETVHCRQGYPACTTLAVDDSHAITSDRGMIKLLREHGINVLEIREGHISLPPYEYGFIGGAAGVYSDTVYFIGNLSLHPDRDAIMDFCHSAGKEVRSLASDALSDLGRIIFIDDGI